MKKLFIISFFFAFLHQGLIAQRFNTGTSSPEARTAYQEGQNALQEDNLPAAKDAFEQAVDLDGRYIDALIGLGMVLSLDEKWDEAENSFHSALELYPRSLRAHQHLALMYQSKGDDESAIEQYQELLRHYPGYPEAYMGLARIFFSQKRYNEARASSEAAMQMYLSSGSYRNAADARMLAGQAYMNLEEYKTALKYFKASKNQVGEKPYYFYYIGLCYFKQGKMDKAREYLLEAKLRGYTIPEYLENSLEQEE